MASPHAAGAAALYIVENPNLAKDRTRWSMVRSGLQGDGWSVPQNDPMVSEPAACGFTKDKPEQSNERLLMLAACDSAP